MNPILAQWNTLPAEQAAQQILPCCGSLAWATQIAAARPIPTPQALTELSDQIWTHLPQQDQQEALATHPRIGERQAAATKKSLAWSVTEQSAATTDESAKASLAEANRQYEDTFHRTFIICASGKSAGEILATLNHRLTNTPEQELAEAAEQQRQITNLRLYKWLEGR
jgi:2-oxo-4-hydroxy-4-carboxy-5-ureidoimidazoline decarboxylase